jgi:hypothetical protein
MTTLESLTIEPIIFYTVDESAKLLRVSPRAMLSLSEWLTVSARSLKEVWDSEEDAIYDQL